MLQRLLWTLRQPRYMALCALMVVVAAGCVLAGTWQISRFQESVHANDALRANAHAAPSALTSSLVPLVGHGAAPSRTAIRFRTVTITGSYLSTAPQFLDRQSSGGTDRFDVLVPFRSSGGVVLVVRGLVPAAADGSPPRSLPAAPSGQLRLTGRLETASTSDDRASSLPDDVIASINPTQQADRLRTPVYQAYLQLAAHQPGSVGTVTPPDLSNPAGGAYEGQHFAYIIQWYLFAGLALIAPFLISRSEVREARRRYLGIDPDNEEFGLEAEPDPGERPQLAGAAPHGAAVALRGAATVARRAGPTPEQWQRAARIADRYGRSLGPEYESAGGDLPAAARRWGRRRGSGPVTTAGAGQPVVDAPPVDPDEDGVRGHHVE